MRQRVAIARAFSTEPDLLFLDEPFGALDALTRANLQQELARLCSDLGRPVATIMITNSVDEALLLWSRVIESLTAGVHAQPDAMYETEVRLEEPVKQSYVCRV